MILPTPSPPSTGNGGSRMFRRDSYQPPYIGPVVYPSWFFQRLCGVLTNHWDVNYSDGYQHGAYCTRCGRHFGNVWGGKHAT